MKPKHTCPAGKASILVAPNIHFTSENRYRPRYKGRFRGTFRSFEAAECALKKAMFDEAESAMMRVMASEDERLAQAIRKAKMQVKADTLKQFNKHFNIYKECQTYLQEWED